MKKMAGMILMIVGVLSFVVGLAVYSSSNKKPELSQSAQPVFNPSVEKDQVIEQPQSASLEESEPVSQAPDNNVDLESIINMAIADGVLTNNERVLIKELSEAKGLNYNEVINDVEERVTQLGGIAETEIVDINKKQGDDFEKFIVQKFNKDLFKIKEWAGDKYVNGKYAQTTLHPDLLLELDLKKETANFSVECKWRNNFYKDGILFATPDQLKRYQQFENSKNIPVFVAIGVGGSGTSPERLFVVPLKKIKSNFIYSNALKKYEKKIDADFFYDIQSQILR